MHFSLFKIFNHFFKNVFQKKKIIRVTFLDIINIMRPSFSTCTQRNLFSLFSERENPLDVEKRTKLAYSN